MSETPPLSRRARKAEGETAPPLTAAEQIAAGDGFEDGRLPTAQLERAAFGDHVLPWTPPQPTAPPQLAPWALALAIVALIASLLTGVLLPLGVVAVLTAIMSLRRANDSRPVAVWALSLAALSVVFSVGWLWWALPQLSMG